jgi:hypothetical protein
MSVFWAIQARRHLRQALAESLCRESHGEASGRGGCGGVLEQTMDRLNDLLAATFPGVSVVVKDQVIGYRRKRDQFILMVEAFGEEDAEHGGPYVVKIGPEEAMRREIKGWTCCRPPGLRHDLVFLNLQAGETLDVDHQNWMSLVYGDAQQFLGIEVTITFEAAALECVRSGFPKLPSLGFVIVQLFERIGHLLYSQGFVDDPARPDFVFDLPKLDGCLELWETDPACLAARRDVNTLAASGVGRFLDPVDYLRYVQAYVPWRDLVAPAVEPESTMPADLLQPKVVDLIPRLLRGCAHGDLHGRNILVGIVRDQAMWPTVFDYEDMGPCNLIGWDFVKLETELKIRAYLDVFGGGPPAAYIKEIQRFEIELALRTEDCHRNRSWPEVDSADTSEARLRGILLAIRRMAAQQLGGGRPGARSGWCWWTSRPVGGRTSAPISRRASPTSWGWWPIGSAWKSPSVSVSRSSGRASSRSGSSGRTSGRSTSACGRSR